ncbi:unnamed protein product [Protopolystoma xenopodis]|uniref:Uncharacterized protein n=1 Tax=Protopolystoma xenopodis TaxID=117903 RepID=A0A448WAJ4_9PLAT|nr:unnamed protein product [Protopolystoma xenopodis]
MVKQAYFQLNIASLRRIHPVTILNTSVNHGTIHQIDVHRRRPLVASACDDGTVLIVHSTVSDDLLSKPVVLPVKLIHTHQGAKTKDMKIDSAMAVFSTIFHTRQPHVYTGSADGTVRQFVDWD